MKLWEKTALILALASIATQVIGSYMQVSQRLRTRILLGLLAFGIVVFSVLITVDVISRREPNEFPNRDVSSSTPTTSTLPERSIAPSYSTVAPTILPNQRVEAIAVSPPPPRPLPTQNIHLSRGHYCLRYRNDTDTDITLVFMGANGEESETLVPSAGKYRFWQQPTSVWLRFQSAANGSLPDRTIWKPAAKSFSRSYDDLTDEEKDSLPMYHFVINPQGKLQLAPE